MNLTKLTRYDDPVQAWVRWWQRSGGVWLFILLALVLIGPSCFYTIDVSEEGVVTRFGKYIKTTPPGLHFKLPLGIDHVDKVASKRRLQEEFGFRTSGFTGGRSTYTDRGFAHESLMLTGDLNVADVSWILQYEISDPWKYLFHARDVQRNIRDVSLSIMRRVVGDRLVTDVLTVGREEVAYEAKKLTQEVLNRYDMGIRIVTINLQDVNPPEPVKPAFNDVNAAKQQQEEVINIAERGYNRVIPEARGRADELISNAQAYAVDIVNRAKGDAARFSLVAEEYRKAPDITRTRVYLEAMEQIMASLHSLTIVDEQVKGLLPIFGQGAHPLFSSDIPKQEK